MKSVIVGTAGHIDHGKTSLVKALTGMDADRLEEEKRRGITIDIGFANLELPAPDGETLRLGFVDVPGHERFVRNMLAGIGGIDLVLFVVSAEESIKPQTREHFDICRLLAVPRGITVLTKADLVDRDTLDVVRLELEEFLRGSFLDVSRSPILAVSTVTGEGIAELKLALAGVASEASAKDSATFARLPIDRVFSMKGFGTVVTGTLIAGSIEKEAELEVFPSNGRDRTRVRVRGVQVHSSTAERAQAGERTALNLASVSTGELVRGMMLAPPDTLRTTQRMDVSLNLLASAKPLKHRARVHFHAYTSEQIAEVFLHSGLPVSPLGERNNGKSLAAGSTALVQLRLSEPTLLLPGDRFILRQFSPVVTIGGGTILDVNPLQRLNKAANSSKNNAAPKPPTNTDLAAWFEVLTHGTAEEILAARVVRRGWQGLSLSDAVAETGLRPERLEAMLAPLLANNVLLRAGDLFGDAAAFKSLADAMLKTVRNFHDANPLVAGMGRRELEEKLGVPQPVFALTLDALVRAKRLTVTGEAIHLAGRTVEMKEDEAEARAVIEQAFASAGLQVPALKVVLEWLKVDRVRSQKIVTLMLREKVLVKVSDDLVFYGKSLDELRARVRQLKDSSPGSQIAKIDVARFKELTGVSRKYAIPLLEWLDRERVTRRVGDERVIL